MIGSLRMLRAKDGKVRRQGLDEPWMDVVKEAGDVLVVKCPAHRVNMSGVRGMPDIHYFSAEFVVLRLHEDRATEIIRFPARGRE